MTQSPQSEAAQTVSVPDPSRAYDMRRLSYAGTFKNPFKAGTIRAIEWLTAKVTLLRLIREFERTGAPVGAPFWPKAIRQMGIRIEELHAIFSQVSYVNVVALDELLHALSE